jgi:hypothetical protein
MYKKCTIAHSAASKYKRALAAKQRPIGSLLKRFFKKEKDERALNVCA